MAVRYSQNGYTSYDRSVITQYVVSDSGRVMNLRKGSPGELLAHFIRWFDKNIRNIDPGIMDDWSYAERPIRGNPDEDSNHASGTAADVDATKWPLGVEATVYLTKAEIAKVKKQLELYEGCIRWGADYVGRKDPMHFEIDRNQATCDRVWAKIRNGTTSTTSGGFLMALTDAEQHEILQRLRGDTAGRGYDMLQSIESIVTDVQFRVRGYHPSMDSLQVIQWMISQITAQAPADVDEAELAEALAALIPDGIAEQVVQKLIARVQA